MHVTHHSMIVQEKEEEKEDDYVYDVYYRDDENIEQSMNSMNIGSLVWFDEQSEYLDDDSDSELGDNVDEDSNGKHLDHVMMDSLLTFIPTSLQLRITIRMIIPRKRTVMNLKIVSGNNRIAGISLN